MSKRPIEAKQRHKVAKAFRQTPERFFNLVDYLVDRRIFPTKRLARQAILDKRVMSESHPIGFVHYGDRMLLSPLVKVAARPNITVKSASS